MNKYVVVTVVNREINTDFFEDIESAKEEMLRTYHEFLDDVEDKDEIDYCTDNSSFAVVTSDYDNVDIAIHRIID